MSSDATPKPAVDPAAIAAAAARVAGVVMPQPAPAEKPPTPVLDELLLQAKEANAAAPPVKPIFDEIFDTVVALEGGYVDDPNDPGGATKFGVTRAVLAAWMNRPVTRDEVKGLTEATAREIFHDRFWRPIAGDKLPPAVAAYVFDMAVNSGPSAAAKLLQQAINSVAPIDLQSDGAIGAKTIAAVDKVDLLRLVEEIHARRSTFYARLKRFEFFGLGWNRRLARVGLFAGRLLLRAPI